MHAGLRRAADGSDDDSRSLNRHMAGQRSLCARLVMYTVVKLQALRVALFSRHRCSFCPLPCLWPLVSEAMMHTQDVCHLSVSRAAFAILMSESGSSCIAKLRLQPDPDGMSIAGRS